MLTEKQKKFRRVTQAVLTEPKPIKLALPDKDRAPFQHMCIALVSWKYWDRAVLWLLVLNVLLLMMPFHDMPVGYATSLQITEHVLAFLFLIELCIRISASGFSHFRHDSWNRFDAAVVIIMFSF